MNRAASNLREMTTPPSSHITAAVSPEARFPRLIGTDPTAWNRLRELTIAVVATGSVGLCLALHFARCSIRCLKLIDPKCFKAESLITHDARPRDIGKPKAEVTARRCKQISPSTCVRYFTGPVEALDLTDLADADLVVMAPDRLEVEVEMAQRCMALGVPLIQASVHGETLTAQVRLYRNSNTNGCCAACFLGASEWDQLAHTPVRYSCEQAVTSPGTLPHDTVTAVGGPVTSSVSSLCSIAADLAMMQATRLALGLGAPLTDSMLEYCGFTQRTLVTELKRNPRCRLDHFQYRRVATTQPLGRQSLAELTRTANLDVANGGAVYEVSGMDWVELGSCQCSQPRPVHRFLPHGQTSKQRCPKCGASVSPLQFYSHDRVSRERLQSAFEKPLQTLGAGQAQHVLVRAGEAGALMTHESTQPAHV